MSTATRLVALTVLAMLGVHSAGTQGDEATTPRKTDFAYGVAIHVTAPGPLQELPLPLDVYRYATRADLGDLRVFNAAGEVVPHGLLPGPLQTPASPRRVPLPAFPFRVGAPLSSSGLDVRIDQNTDITRIIVRGGAVPATGEQAWLVDAGGLDDGARALVLSWPASATPFTRRVKLEGSHDLSRWYLLGNATTIADVSWAGERLLANRVELPSGRYPWYRLVADDRAGSLPAFSFEAELAPTAQGRGAREWLPVQTLPGDDQAGELRFTTPAALPVERVRIQPADRNTYLRLRVQARALNDETWRDAGHGSVYRLDFDNATLTGQPLTVRAPGALEWRLLPSAQASATGTGFGHAAPLVEVGWTPRSLVFLARGDGPYTLAFASRRVTPVLADGRRLLGDDIAIIGLPLASAGDTQPLGDATYALATTREIDWKRWALWSVLVGGAVLLGFLAFRLLRTGTPPKA